MSALFTNVSTVDAIATTVIATGGCVALLWKPIRVTKRFLGSVALAIHAIHGSPAEAHRPAVPGLLERVDSIGAIVNDLTAAVGTIKHEVLPNGGQSIKDSVSRLELAVGSQGIRLDQAQTDRATNSTDIKSDIAALSQRLDHHIDTASKERP